MAHGGQPKLCFWMLIGDCLMFAGCRSGSGNISLVSPDLPVSAQHPRQLAPFPIISVHDHHWPALVLRRQTRCPPVTLVILRYCVCGMCCTARIFRYWHHLCCELSKCYALACFGSMLRRLCVLAGGCPLDESDRAGQWSLLLEFCVQEGA